MIILDASLSRDVWWEGPPWFGDLEISPNDFGNYLLLELAFDDTFVKTYQWSSISKPIQEFYMLKTSQRESLWLCFVIFNSMLKALKYTHTS